MYWEGLGVRSDSDGNDGRRIAAELLISYIFDRMNEMFDL